MPPKKKSRGATPTARGEGRTTRSSARKAKSDHTESEGSASSDDEKPFDKGHVMSVMRYDFEDLVTNDRFEHPHLISKIDPKEFNLEYYEKSRLATPLLFECDAHELGMKVPNADEFSVDDVLRLVGGNRMIEVVEVSGQTSVKMCLQDFVDYYKTPREQRETLYNVLSLEFSNTEMEDLIQSPTLVRQIDWVDNHWPDALRQRYITFNKKGHYTPHHTYPKVQKIPLNKESFVISLLPLLSGFFMLIFPLHYCLMSVERCYTDFHVDFGGTSVWYHVLKGQKIFWLVEPSLTNIRLYEEFVKNPEQTGFFGHVVDECARVVLNPGTTAIIPSGWIHAVYTPSDSLVFGGNFLHSLRAEMQIQVYLSENRINVSLYFLKFYFLFLLYTDISLFRFTSLLYLYNDIFHDLYGRSTSAHRNPVGEEPPIEFNQAELDRISHLLLPEYERLCEYLRKKRLLDVAEGITQPASLLNCFNCILQKRREQLVSGLLTLFDPKRWAWGQRSVLFLRGRLVELNLIEPLPVKEAKPKRSYKRQAQGSPRTPRSTKARQSGPSKESAGEETEEHEHINTEDETNVNEVANGSGEAEMVSFIL
ncbi:JmjC domain protein [Cooperia oncophora]